MTTSTQILADAIERVRETSRSAGHGLSPEVLEARVDAEANTIGWLLWHLARGQDAQVAGVMGEAQVWTEGGWSGRFDLSLPEFSTGYAHTADDVAQVRGLTSELLLGYVDAVCDRTSAYLSTLGEDDLDKVVDERFTPPVTLAVRLVSVISDDLQHAGQAAFIRGVLERRS